MRSLCTEFSARGPTFYSFVSVAPSGRRRFCVVSDPGVAWRSAAYPGLLYVTPFGVKSSALIDSQG
jgi:hypothetical protein